MRNIIIVTGAAGFIGSCLISKLLSEKSSYKVIGVDKFNIVSKYENIKNKNIETIDRGFFFDWIKENHSLVRYIYHLGARTDTAEQNKGIFQELNIDYSKSIWKICTSYQIPLVYASSAATYGAGEYGYDDTEDNIRFLKPLNPYGESKNSFDFWALEQSEKPPFWVGLKFFNVYGPNEYHKGRMASVMFHSYNQVISNGEINLFRSHKTEYKDGEQVRDFIYVKDLIDVCIFLFENDLKPLSGIYNLGSGVGRTFIDLVSIVFKSLNISPKINYIDIPEDIRNTYQYYTQANMHKLTKAGYTKQFHSLEEGITDYIQNYLIGTKYL